MKISRFAGVLFFLFRNKWGLRPGRTPAPLGRSCSLRNKGGSFYSETTDARRTERPMQRLRLFALSKPEPLKLTPYAFVSLEEVVDQ